MTDVAGALFDSLVPGSGIGVAVHGEDLRMLMISPSLAELSGAPAEELLGRRLVDALPGAIGRYAEDSIREVAETRKPLIGLEPAVEAGRERGWLISVYPLEHDGRELTAVVAQDVTQSRVAQERLVASRRRLAEGERMAAVGSWSWDVAANRWSWSDELFRLGGLEPEVEAPPLDALLESMPPESAEAVRAVTLNALRGGEAYEVSFAIRRRSDGALRELRGRGVPARDEGGRIVRVDGFAQDVTELRRAEGQQRAAAVLGRLALSGMPVDELIHQAVDAVAEELVLDSAAFAERLEDGRLLVRAISGGGEPTVDGAPVHPAPGALSDHALRTGVPVVVPDWEREERMAIPPLVTRFGLRSSAAVVVGPAERPIGVLAGHSRETDGIGPDAVAFLETVANIVGLAAQRAGVEAEIRAQSAARGRLVAQALDAEDRARRGISEALHDGPLQDLLVLGHDISRLRAAADGDEAHLDRLRDGVANAIRQIREAMLDLHPVVLQVGGLQSALSAVCSQHAGAGGYECEVRIDAAATGRRDELVLSLARELLRNVAKHAGAAKVTVEVRHTPAGVLLDVTDDGTGILPGRLEEALAHGHIGVASSRERAEAIGGRLRVGARSDGRPGAQAVALLPDPETV